MSYVQEQIHGEQNMSLILSLSPVDDPRSSFVNTENVADITDDIEQSKILGKLTKKQYLLFIIIIRYEYS